MPSAPVNPFQAASSGFGAVGGAVSDLFSADATAASLRTKSEGLYAEASNDDLAAQLARENEEFATESTSIKLMQQTRETELGLGTTRADVAGAGFSESGSAGDLMRAGAQQSALLRQVTGQQGLITEAGYHEQAQSFDQMASTARQTASEEIDQAHKAVEAGTIGAVLKGVSAVASFASPMGGG